MCKPFTLFINVKAFFIMALFWIFGYVFGRIFFGNGKEWWLFWWTIFLPSLKSCAKLKDLNIGLGVHDQIARTRFLKDAIYVGRSSYWYVCGMRMHYERKAIFICSFVFVDLSASTRSVEQWLICMRSNWVSVVIDMYVECGCITKEKRSPSVHLILLTFRPVQGV